MAWTDIAAYTIDRVFGFQSANALRENSIALKDVPFVIKSASAPANFLPNAQALDVLATGYLKNTTGTGVLTTVPTVPVADLPANLKTQSLTFYVAHFASPGSSIATGFAGVLVVPWACTITQVTLLSSDPAVTSGSIVIDIWKDTYANYPPTVADTITASAKPTITTATKSQDSTLTGWTTTLAAGDILAFNVDSVTSLTRVRIDLRVTLT